MIAHEAPTTGHPAEGVLDHPPARQNLSEELVQSAPLAAVILL